LPVVYLEAAKPRHSFPVGTAGQSLLPHLPGLPSPKPEFPDAAALLITKFPGFVFGHPGWHVEHVHQNVAKSDHGDMCGFALSTSDLAMFDTISILRRESRWFFKSIRAAARDSG
jgi:hypothetical protein